MIGLLIYGLITVTMPLCASFVKRKERMEALFSAGVLCANWVLFQVAVQPETNAYSVAWGIYNVTGAGFDNSEIWAVTDALSAAAILSCAYDTKWAYALWGLLSGQVIIHIGSGSGHIPFPDYNDQLNWLWFGQVGIFWIIGGGGLASFIGSHLRDFASFINSLGATQSQARSKKE